MKTNYSMNGEISLTISKAVNWMINCVILSAMASATCFVGTFITRALDLESAMLFTCGVIFMGIAVWLYNLAIDRADSEDAKSYLANQTAPAVTVLAGSALVIIGAMIAAILI
jgi:hypothetical protein